MLSEYKDFVADQNFKYQSDAENHLSMLLEDIPDKYTDITGELSELKTKITNIIQEAEVLQKFCFKIRKWF